MNRESEIRDDCRCKTGLSAAAGCCVIRDGAEEEINTIGSLLRGLAQRTTSDDETTGALEAGVLGVDADAEPKVSAFTRRAATFDNEVTGALDASVFDVDADADAEAEANTFG